jgi:hypothetical protein
MRGREERNRVGSLPPCRLLLASRPRLGYRHDNLEAAARAAKDRLDEHTCKTVHWHFSENTGSPFWLEKRSQLKIDPLKEVQGFDDLRKFPDFEDEWLRGGPINRWVPKGHAGKPVYVFETGGTTGIPKSRMVIEDHWKDYELLPDKYFPKGSNWLMLGPSGPRRLRLAVEHLAQYRGGICFCIDLDPRWVIKLIKKGWMDHLEEYKKHCIDQAITILSAGHDIKCAFATPKLLEALCLELEKQGKSFKDTGITGIFSGGTEFTPQWTRFCVEEFFGGPPEESGVDYDQVVPYGGTGRVKLYTLTDEFFVPGFMERDEGEREQPFQKYPWDGVSGVRPFHEFAKTTTVGVY